MYEIDHAYELKLKALHQRYLDRKKLTEKTFPPLTPFAAVVLKDTAPALKRMLRHIIDNQGARSDEISRACAIGNVSDTVHNHRAQDVLKKLGLFVTCETEPARNRYGQKTLIGRWWVTVADLDRWNGKYSNIPSAANDPTSTAVAECG